jgi:hypothetical protein
MLELRRSSQGPLPARVWLDEQVGNAIAGLLPVAAGDGELAGAAVEFLRESTRAGLAPLIEERLRRAKKDVAERVRRTVLEHEAKAPAPLDDSASPDWLQAALKATPDEKGRLPAWVSPATLPPVVVKKRRLNEGQVRRLLAALKKGPLDDPSPLIVAVKEHANRTSLDAFAWRLFERWLAEDAPSKDKWALNAVGHLGGDASVKKLTPLVQAWPAASLSARARQGLECTGAIGTGAARAALEEIADDRSVKGLHKRARELLDIIPRD